MLRTVNNSPNSFEADVSVAKIHKSIISAFQTALIHTSIEDKTHEWEYQSNLPKSSDYYVIHTSVSSNSNNLLHHKPEDRSSSGSTPTAIDSSHSTTVLQHTVATNTSKNVQEKCQTGSVQESLYSNTVFPIPGHAAKNISKIHLPVPLVNSSLKYSETGDVNKSGTTVSNTLDGRHDCVVVTYDKENIIQKPHSNNVNPMGKPLNNTANDIQIYNSKDERNNLNSGQARVHDIGSRSACNSENNATLTKQNILFQMLAKNHTDSETTVNYKDIICGTTVVENTTLPSIKVISSTINESPKPFPNTGNSHKSASPLSSTNIKPSEEFTVGVTPDVQKSNQPSYIVPDSVANVSKSALKVTRAPLPERDISTSNIEAMFNILQHKSGSPSVPPSIPLALLTEQVKGVQSYMPKSVGPVASVNKRNKPIISGLDNSHDRKEHSAIEMRVPPEQQISNRTLTVHKHGTPSSMVKSTCTSGENHSLSTLSASNPPSKIMASMSVSQEKPSPGITNIEASTREMLLSPSMVSDVIRAVGSKLGMFLENDDTVENNSQVPEYSGSRTVPTYVTPECSVPQFGRNFTIPYQTSSSATLQAQRNVTVSTGQGVQVPMSHTNQIPLNTIIYNQPLTSLPPPQAQFTQVMTSTNYTHRAPNFVPNDYQRIPSRHITPVSKPIERRKRVLKECSGRTKRRKYGPRNKLPTSKQKTKEAKLGYLLEENLRSLLASIKAALPSTGMVATQEKLQSTLMDPNEEKQLGLSTTERSQELETNTGSIGKQQHCYESSGVEEDEAQQQDISPEVSTADIDKLNKLRSFRIKITKTNGKYRSSSVQNANSECIHRDPHSLSTPENGLLQNAAQEERPFIRISQLKPYQLAPFVVVKRLMKFFVPNVTYKLTDVHVTNLLDNK
jgi:hypothetical protein